MDIVPLIVNGPFDYSEWGKGNPLEGYDVKIYTECSKMSCGVGSAIISDDLAISL